MELLSRAELTLMLTRVPEWSLEGQAIQREFEFDDLAQAKDFVSEVQQLAAQANHHPTVSIKYNLVTLKLFTHDEGGLTGRDFALAEQIDGTA